MGFETGNKKDGKHYWLTPPELYKECPFPKPEGFDGLKAEWGSSSARWINGCLNC